MSSLATCEDVFREQSESDMVLQPFPDQYFQKQTSNSAACGDVFLVQPESDMRE